MPRNTAAVQKTRRLDPKTIRIDSHHLHQVGVGLKALNMRCDAGETAFFARQLEFIKARTYDKLYPELKARLLIPVSYEVGEWAEAFTWRSWDWAGMAKIIANHADDLPRVDVMAQEKTQGIKSLGTSYSYSTHDLRASQKLDRPLDQKRSDAARRAHENLIESLAVSGDSTASLPGFANNSNVTLLDSSDINGDWATASADEMYEDLSTIYSSVRLASKGIFECDTIALPLVSYDQVSEKIFSTLTGETVLQAWLKNHPSIKRVEPWPWLDTADTAGTGPRGIAYKRDPEVVELVIPMEMVQSAPQAKNLAFVVPCEGRYGGVCVYYPLGMVYFEDL